MAIEDELSGLNRELSMFPSRAFEFEAAGTVVIEQDVADVGSVVWDAEVLLAHYIDQAYGSRLRGMRVVELGAGTGLAGIVAARLGARVFITDQSKLLPTIIDNARANAPELEEPRRPPPWPLNKDRAQALPPPSPPPPPPPPTVGNPNPEDVSAPPPIAENATSTANPKPDVAPFSESAARESTARSEDVRRRAKRSGGGGDEEFDLTEPSPRPRIEMDAGRRRCGCASNKGGGWAVLPSDGLAGSEGMASVLGESCHRCVGFGDGGCGGCRGSWCAMELLFSESEQEVLNGLGAGGGYGRGRGGGVEGVDGGAGVREQPGDDEELFDLVVAADVVYLNDLWEAMACTIKALLKPTGEALMTFEQRRSNVDGFFGPPRFGNRSGATFSSEREPDDPWEDGEELNMGEGVGGDGLGDAARAARVRLFRMKRRPNTL